MNLRGGWLDKLPVFLGHATIEVALLRIVGRLYVGEPCEHLLYVASDVEAKCLAGGDALLQLVGGTGIVAAEEQTGQIEAVAGAELLMQVIVISYSLTA